MSAIAELPTPALLVDLDVLDANVRFAAERARSLGVSLRPHVKTHKCVEVAARQRAAGARGLTVSTLTEARVFADHGFDDLTWAFPVIPGRLEEARALASRVTLRIVVDTAEGVDAVERTGHPFHVWLKVDCGYHRAGVDPATAEARRLAARLHESRRLTFDGILTHSGHAYAARSPDQRARVAAEERDVMARFADRLRADGIEVAGVSIGSTPALGAYAALDGVSEIRPGNYVFYDRTQVALGVCAVSDCAVTVLASVVSSRAAANRSVVDAGALALSKDAGPDAAGPPDMGGLYAEYPGGLRADARLVSLSQEHGVVDAALPVGERVRILPNHSCLTVACFDELAVVRGDQVVDRWKVWRGR